MRARERTTSILALPSSPSCVVRQSTSEESLQLLGKYWNSLLFWTGSVRQRGRQYSCAHFYWISGVPRPPAYSCFGHGCSGEKRNPAGCLLYWMGFWHKCGTLIHLQNGTIFQYRRRKFLKAKYLGA